ncbi:uncharacterized protein TNCV_1613691 [Trichonephila clavipes]|nr:uncharacterized protein TNCV_1613691 [Trichonephila clavipes]
MTPQQSPLLLTATPHQLEDVSALDRFNVHRCATRRVFNATGLELVTRQAMVQYLYQSATAATGGHRYRTVACFVTGSSPVPLKTRRVGQRCTLNLSRAETSSRWCGVVVRRGGASSGVVHVT